MEKPHNAVPGDLIFLFCEAIQYSKDDRSPDASEHSHLTSVLGTIAVHAHGNDLTPERVLIDLKKAWTRVCKRDPSPDMFDARWSQVVETFLEVYEERRHSVA
jgi:hypothetical protein